MSSELIFYVNGKEVTVHNPDPESNLLSFLRQELNLTGTKLGCGEGGCGACTVLATKFVEGQPRYMSLNACLAPLCSMHGLAITTVEGVGSTKTKLHPIQETLATSHGSQCGFCTPGFVMSMYCLLCNQSCPDPPDVEQAFQGNLCRCTGYRPILQGFTNLIEDIRNDLKKVSTVNDNLEVLNDMKMKTSQMDSMKLHFKSDRVEWFRPTSLHDLLDLKQQHPQAKLVVGNTELGIEMRLKNMHYPVLIAATHVPALTSLKRVESGIVVGSSVTLKDLERCLETEVLTNSAEKTKFFAVVLEMLKWFASNQIRNVAAIGGNIITASPISDLNPLLISASSNLALVSKSDGVRKVPMNEQFFTGYRKTVLKPTEILLNVELPYSSKNEYYGAYKQSRRREDDISLVNAAMKVVFKRDWIIEGATFAFGGMAPTTVVAKMASKAAIGRKWDDEMLGAVMASLKDELFLEPGIPGGMEGYRSSLVLSLFFKFYLDIRLQLEEAHPNFHAPLVKVRDESARHHYHHQSGDPSFVQIYDDDDDDIEDIFDGDNEDDGARWNGINERIVNHGVAKHNLKIGQCESSQVNGINGTSNRDLDSFEGSKKEGGSKFKVVGKPMVHLSAFKQTSGEAVYVDDMPSYKDELFASFVLSTKAHAKILNVDNTDALNIPGVVAYLDHKDVQGSNNFGDHMSGPDEQVFAKDLVRCQGQIIGVVLSSDRSVARRAASSVRVQYEELKPILTIEDAIASNSFHRSSLHNYICGNPIAAMETTDHVIEGEVSIGGQEHFYLEPNASLVVPLEDGGVETFVSCQHPAAIQECGASVLGVDHNKIHSRVLRMGGAFGGKEMKPIMVSMPCLVAAQKLKRPVRCVLDRDEDMLITAGRHPYMARYKVGFTEEGKIISVVLDLYSNCGCTYDHSEAIMERSVFHTENSYNIPNLLVRGHLCKTNLPSNTAFRGFGSPQSIFVCETYVKEIADYLNLPAYKVKEMNMYREGDETPYKQLLDNFTLQKCWQQVIQQSDFQRQLKEVELFNSRNRWKKRGVSLMPLKYGAGYGYNVLNQGGALVNIFKDGSVLVSHGGTEMGQGLHTKMIQVASQVLNIPMSLIHIAESDASIVPNASATAASFGSDINGMAVLRACKNLVARLKPFMEKHPDKGWRFWVHEAYKERISLSSVGFVKIPNLFFDTSTNSGNKFSYFTIASACCLVEIDCLTGDHQVLRTDIVLDVGRSLNPAIDVGQIEGGFIQGYGLFTMEELKYSPEGSLYTRGPGAYKIPSVGDIPRSFNVTLLKNCPNPKAVYSSKAIGEPPLLTSLAVFEAIKEAVQSARRDAGIKEARLRFDSPATCERIRMACSDDFTQMYDKIPPANYKPWFIKV